MAISTELLHHRVGDAGDDAVDVPGVGARIDHGLDQLGQAVVSLDDVGDRAGPPDRIGDDHRRGLLVAGEVAEVDCSQQLARRVQHRQVVDVPLLHPLEGFVDGRVGRDGGDGSAHDGAHRALRVETFADHALAEVMVGRDAHEVSVRPGDERGRRPVLLHQTRPAAPSRSCHGEGGGDRLGDGLAQEEQRRLESGDQRLPLLLGSSAAWRCPRGCRPGRPAGRPRRSTSTANSETSARPPSSRRRPRW